MTLRPLALLAALAFALSLPASAKPPAKKAPAAAGASSARHTFKLSHRPVPGPGPVALVHVPKGFKKGGTLNLVVHYHGFGNCIERAVEAKNGPCGGSGFYQGYGLLDQMDSSGVNAVFVAIQLAYAKAVSDPGKLKDQDFFKDLITELLPEINKLTGKSYGIDDLGKIVLTTHSGGYWAVASTLAKGGLDIHEVLLFDSLNNPKKGESKTPMIEYTNWCKQNRRCKSIFTDGSGTRAFSLTLAQQMGGPSSDLFLDDSKKVKDDKVKESDIAKKGFFFRTGLVHDDTPRKWYARLLKHAGL